jgi:nucleoside-diphosphate-sugar epimerase
MLAKGAVRVKMERMLAVAAKDGVRSVVIRAGDFFGPHQPASWFKELMVKPGRPVVSVVHPGEVATGHVWAYLPELAETFVRVAEMKTSLPAFETLHFGGHWLVRGDEMAKAILRVAGLPETRIKAAPRWLYRLMTPVTAFLREAIEMRYLWQVPVQLDNRKLVALLGTEP